MRKTTTDGVWPRPSRTVALPDEEAPPMPSGCPEFYFLRSPSVPFGAARTRNAKFGGRFPDKAYDARMGWFQATLISADLPRLATRAILIDFVAKVERPKMMKAWSVRDQKYKYPTDALPLNRKPDRDNIDKAVLDGLDKLGILTDDKVVFYGSLEKWYVDLLGMELDEKTKKPAYERWERPCLALWIAEYPLPDIPSAY